MNAEAARSLMLRKLAASGLDAADAGALRFRPLAQAPGELPFRDPGFVIPYLNNGGFFRYRYLVPVYARNKLVRYAQPAGSCNHLYVPPNYGWREWAARPADQKRLIVTEGELKSAAAAKAGLPCVGLGGVWSFKSRSQALLPELRNLIENGMPVYIAFDSDAAANPNVVGAENALAKELLALGAMVHVARLPALEPGKKTGVDDFLVSPEGGADRLVDLILGTEPWEPSRVLHGMNERFVFVRDPGLVADLANRQLMSPEKFRESVCANLYYEAQAQRGSRVVTVKKKAAPAWLGWERRTEVARMTYAPGGDRVTPGGLLNTWRGWGVPESEVRRGDVSPWAGLLDFLSRGAPDERKWFEQWCAHHVQFPDRKMFTAVVLWGRHKGTGKTLVGNTLGRIYGENYREIVEADLTSDFNDWAAGRQFILGDEIAGSHDKRGSADRLKGLVTRLEVTINEKHLPRYTLEDRISYLFTSNHPNSFFIDDEERRYFVREVQGPPLPREFYRAYDAWYRAAGPDGRTLPGPGIGPLMHHLLRLDLRGFDALGPAPRTEGMRNMAEAARFPVEEWAMAVADDPDGVRCLPPGRSLMSTRELYGAWCLYNGGADKTTPQHVGIALSAAGLRRVYKGGKVECAEGRLALWAVRDREALLGAGHRALAERRNAESARAKV